MTEAEKFEDSIVGETIGLQAVMMAVIEAAGLDPKAVERRALDILREGPTVDMEVDDVAAASGWMTAARELISDVIFSDRRRRRK